MKKLIFKVEAEGDTVYIFADSLIDAMEKFQGIMGDIPEDLLTWTQVDKVPAGEIAL